MPAYLPDTFVMIWHISLTLMYVYCILKCVTANVNPVQLLQYTVKELLVFVFCYITSLASNGFSHKTCVSELNSYLVSRTSHLKEEPFWWKSVC